MSEQSVRQFVDLLYPPDARLPEDARFSLWELPGKRSYHYKVADPELEIAAHALDREGLNVFFGVGLRCGDLGSHARGAKTDVVALPGFWADVDIRGLNHAADNLPANIIDVIQGILAPFDWEPSAVINSGGGIHAYWLFEAPLLIDDANRGEVEELSKSFQERLALGAQKQGWKWDMTADLARVLRPVGTHNRKNEPRPVEFMGTPGGTRYSYSLFQKALKTKAGPIASLLGRAASSGPVANAPSAIRTIDTRTPGQILNELEEKFRRNKKDERRIILEQILNGEPFAGTGERDKILQQVSSWIAFYDQIADPEILAEILVPSLDAMAAAEPNGAMTLDDAVEKISRAQNDARRKSLQDETAKNNVQAAMHKMARGKIEKLAKPTELAVVPEPPSSEAKPAGGALPIERAEGILRALAVIQSPKDSESAEVIDALPDSYSKDELENWRAKHERLSNQKIPFPEFKRRHIIATDNAVYVMRNGKYETPISVKNFRMASHHDLCLLPDYVDGDYYFSPLKYTKDGTVRRKTDSEVFDELGRVARRVVVDLSLQESYFDGEKQTFFEAVCPVRADLTPAFDSHIDTWLRKLGGEDTDKLLDWIATVTFLHAPSCGLILTGAKDAGKTLLANGLARIFHMGGATRMENIVGGFNDDITRCPIVVADEALPETGNGRTISTKKLRDMISNPPGGLKRKFMANVPVNGTIRCMFLANSERMLDLGDEILGPDALAAVASRFLHITVNSEPAQYLRSLGGRHGGTGQWLEGDLIARHALWLRDNRKVVPGRFWVEGHQTKMHRLLQASSTISSLVVEWIVRFIHDPRGAAKATGLVLVGNGEVWVHTNAIAESWDDYIKTKPGAPPTRKIAEALKGLADEEGKNADKGGRNLRWRGKQRRYWSVSPNVVMAWATENGIGDVSELLAVINAPTDDWA